MKSFTSSSEAFAGEDTCWVSLGQSQFCTHFHGSRHTQPLKYISRQNSKLNKVYISYINLINRDKSPNMPKSYHWPHVSIYISKYIDLLV